MAVRSQPSNVTHRIEGYAAQHDRNLIEHGANHVVLLRFARSVPLSSPKQKTGCLLRWVREVVPDCGL
jgi:hypothetical protein